MLFLLLAAAEPVTAVDAERAFAADAEALGQWTAFRKWAGPHATMFLPRPTDDAVEAMKDWRDPPKSIRWQPAASYLACDGTMAANSGIWAAPDAGVGFFSTIWIRRENGWRWDVDGGDRLASPRTAPATPVVRRASCTGTPTPQATTPPDRRGVTTGYGHAPDGTLQWAYRVEPDGARIFTVDLWDGAAMQRVIDDRVAAPRATAPARP